MANDSNTGVKDTNYDLISMIHHTMEATVRYTEYIKDAEEAGDQELAQFFTETQNAAKTTGQKAQDHLAKRLAK